MPNRSNDRKRDVASRVRLKPYLERLEERALLAVISGSVYHDLNGDGLHDVGEIGTSGAVVYLDQNENHSRDIGESFQITGSDGAFSFPGLPDGVYRLAQELSAGWVQTSPGPITGPDLFGQVLQAATASGSSPQGIAWANGKIYQADFDVGVLYEFDPVTGNATQQTYPAPTGLSDLTFDGQDFWAIQWQESTGTRRIVRFNALGPGATGNVLQSFNPPSSVPNGIAWADGSLWVADHADSAIYKLNPSTGAVQATIAGPGTARAGLEFDGQYLWLLSRGDQSAYQIDPASGTVLRSFKTPQGGSWSEQTADPTGIAFDGQSMWILNAQDRLLAKTDIRLPSVRQVVIAGSDAGDVEFGRFALGAVSGQVLDDSNNPLTGWRVYVDRNTDGQWQRWEPSALSDMSGQFTISGLAPGSHVVREQVRQPGWQASVDGPLRTVTPHSGEMIAVQFSNQHVSLGPVGTEFQVNAQTDGTQEGPAVAVDAAGNYAVVWNGKGTGDDTGVFMRLYGANGQPRTTEIRVNATTSLAQRGAVIGMADNGRFAVAWTSYIDSERRNAVVRLFDKNGVPVSGEIIVYSKSGESGWPSRVGMDAQGNFAVLYGTVSHKPLSNSFLKDYRIQRFNAQGVAQGSATIVYTPGCLNCGVDMAMNAGGNYTFVWGGVGGGTDSGIFARRYTATGSAIDSAPLRIADPGWKTNPSVALNAQNQFVVSWADGGIYARAFQADASPASPIISAGQGGRGVAMTDAGDFAIITRDSNNLQLSLYGLQGARKAAPSTVNTTLDGANDVYSSAIAMNRTGSGLIVGWHGSAAGDQNGVFAQRYATPDAANPPPPPPPPAGVTVSPTSGLKTTEVGGTASFTVVLTSQPTANVSIPVSSSDTTEGLPLISSLLFTPENWSVPQTVTIRGVDDSIRDGDINYTVVLGAATSDDSRYQGFNANDVTVTNVDNEKGKITASSSSSLTAASTDAALLSLLDEDESITKKSKVPA